FAGGTAGRGGGAGGGGAGLGGAIFNMGAYPGQGILTIVNSTLTGNSAIGGHGGDAPALTGFGLTGGNGGDGLGGALFSLDGAVTIYNATLAGNTVTGGAAGAGETAGAAGSFAGGAVYNLAFGHRIDTGADVSANMTLYNSIFANSVGGVDVFSDAKGTNSASASGDHNLMETATFFHTTVGSFLILTSDDPGLAGLADNGGPTKTLLPSAGAVLGQGDPSLITTPPFSTPATDQRGFPRIQHGKVDIGAVQTQPTASDAFSGNSPTLGGNWTPQSGTVAVQSGLAVSMGNLNVQTLNGFSETDVVVQADIDVSAANSAAGLIARYAGTGDQNMYWAGLVNVNGTGVALICRNVAGTWTTLTPLIAVFLNTSTQLGLSGNMRFEVFGATLKLFLRDTLVAVVNDSALTAAGLVGIRSNAGATFNNFNAVQHAPGLGIPSTFSDDFSTSNYSGATNLPSTTGSELGLNWKEQVGAYGLASGLANSDTSLDVATLNAVSVANVVVSGDISLATNSAAGLVARYSGTGDQNMYWGAIVNVNGQNFACIFRNVAGTWSLLTSSTTLIGSNTAVGSTGTLRFEVFGSSLKLFLNGSLIAFAYDSMLTAPGSVGIRSNSGASFDRFSVVPHAAALPGSLGSTETFNSTRYDGVTNTEDSSGTELPLDWTEHIGAFATGPGSATALAPLELATVNGSTANLTITINATIANIGQSIGAVARYSGPDDSNMYHGRIIKTGATTVTLEIWKNLGGVWSMLASQLGVTYTGSFNFSVSSNTLHLIVDATDLAFTDISSPIAAPGAWGVRATAGTTMTSFSAN
ncbi:unnamed protein product, partial [uncultured bacterium]